MLELRDLHFSIGEKVILKGISAKFFPNGIHGIVGPNGSGKSTLLKNICRVWEPGLGRIRIDGKDQRSLSRKRLSRIVTLVPQNTTIDFPISVEDFVTMGRNPHLGRFQPLRKRDHEVVDWALKVTGTELLRERDITEVSGGECQLAIIARALATEASLILLDEPTSDLDIKHSLTIMDLMVSMKEKGKTFLVSIHDINLARRYCDTATIIHDGKLFFSGNPEEAFSQENLKQVFDVDALEIRSDSKSFLYFH